MFFPITTFPVAANPCGIGTQRNVLVGGSAYQAAAWNGVNFGILFNEAAPIAQAAFSPTGLTGSWTQHNPTDPGTKLYVDMVAVSGNFVALIQGSVTQKYVAISADQGVSWAFNGAPALGVTNWSKLVYNGAVLIAIGTNVPGWGVSGDGGVTWALVAGLPNEAWSAGAWNGNDFCVVGQNTRTTLTSPDGINWTVNLLALPQVVPWIAIKWNGNVFCAIATGTNVCATSPDGVVWTQQNITNVLSYRSLLVHGTDLYAIAAGTAVTRISLNDGVTWTSCALPLSSNWKASTIDPVLAKALVISSNFQVGATIQF